MRRTQIYLDEEIYKYLKEESKKTGKSISELIREKLKKEINQNKENLLKVIKEVSGIWDYQAEDVEGSVRNIRKGNRIDNF
ncbi:ribbon-helix-helix protein, CopG family [Persephonella sp.]|uniref:ribbon-helix-helix protein, CopG family n=1 Tax=Persephonella sp. TaxID=2060922 RepID=UPI0025FB400B|nr:ribbon-helix-helix protein, CopG family [Persephonella sp.]